MYTLLYHSSESSYCGLHILCHFHILMVQEITVTGHVLTLTCQELKLFNFG